MSGNDDRRARSWDEIRAEKTASGELDEAALAAGRAKIVQAEADYLAHLDGLLVKGTSEGWLTRTTGQRVRTDGRDRVKLTVLLDEYELADLAEKADADGLSVPNAARVAILDAIDGIDLDLTPLYNADGTRFTEADANRISEELENGPTADTLVLPDATAQGWAERIVTKTDLPPHVEVKIEPAGDYPGQGLAVDVWAPTPMLCTITVQLLRAAMADQQPRLASEIDAETEARQGVAR